MLVQDEVLTEQEQDELDLYESTIEEGQTSFLKTATAIYMIGVRKLYRPHKSLADYGRERWEMSASMVSRYKSAGRVLGNLEKHEFRKLPTNEGQCRELGKVSLNKQREVWKQIIEQANGNDITAAVIKEAVDEVLGEKDRPSIQQVATTIEIETIPQESFGSSTIPDALEAIGWKIKKLGEHRYKVTATTEKTKVFQRLVGLARHLRSVKIDFGK